MTPERYRMVDYLYPHWIDPFTFITNTVKSEQKMNKFLRPLSIPIWITLIMVFILFFLFNFAHDAIMSPIIRYHNNNNRNNREEHLVWIALREFFRQPYQWFNRLNLSKKITIICWTVAILVLTSTYSGCLLSELTIPDRNQIDNIWELFKMFRSGQIIMVGSAVSMDIFKTVIL